MAKLIGIDYGEKKVGIALSDDDGSVAFPKEIVKNDNNLVNYVADLVEKESISNIVIGHSVNYKGEDNPIMDRIRQFKNVLDTRLSVPVSFEAEFLTSVEAKRRPKEVSEPRSRKKRVNKNIDASAAAIILQSFIDKNKNNI